MVLLILVISRTKQIHSTDCLLEITHGEREITLSELRSYRWANNYYGAHLSTNRHDSTTPPPFFYFLMEIKWGWLTSHLHIRSKFNILFFLILCFSLEIKQNFWVERKNLTFNNKRWLLKKSTNYLTRIASKCQNWVG